MLYLTNIEPLDRISCRITLEDNGKPLCYELDIGWRRDGTVSRVDIPRSMDESLRDYEPQGDVGPARGAINIPPTPILTRLVASFLMGQSLTLPMRIDDFKELPPVAVKDEEPSAVLLLTSIEPLDKTTCRVRLEDDGKPLCYDLEVRWDCDGTLAGVDIPDQVWVDLEHYEPQFDWGPARGALYIPAIRTVERLMYRFLTGMPLTLPLRIDNIREDPFTSVIDD